MNDTRLARRCTRGGVHIGVSFDETLPDREVVDAIVVDELEYSIVPSTPLLRAKLAVDSAEVLMIEQTVRRGTVPFLLQTTYHRLDDDELSARVLAMNTAGRTVPFDDFFQRMFGVARGRSSVSIEAVRCDERTAGILAVEESSPLLVREIVYFDAAGEARAVGYSHFRADHVALRQVRPG
ncbi:UTRA domain-containing protein [Rhodococcoides kyotonense]|uniref:GntR family transcriptional regulator n=1 Tax=Rhodococcoides kyotonense TaxID=398843 RepID=A0A239E216_9NOCA|nr:UTRA domain-containing protein [Rhodococcus kyotonensis]SNS38033.1 GntR family transcriptional regulator [Rhodococcus kyotonensis]